MIAPSGVKAFFMDSWTPPAVVSTNFVDCVRPAAWACFIKIGASPDQNEEKTRSGLACCSAATWEVKLVSPSLGHRSATGATFMPNFFMMARKAAQLSRPYEEWLGMPAPVLSLP